MKKNRNKLISKYVFWAIVAVAAASVLSSCSCDWHLRRVQSRCPEYLAVDTVVDVRPAVRCDTAFILRADTVPDTFVVERERVRVRIVRQRDTLRTTVELPPDTVAITRTTTVAAPCPKRGVPWTLVPWLLGLAAVAALWVGKKIRG